ncbi:ferritin [Kineosporia sp. J2-2]|uniref:Ferritin n=1 Tax=Kineosporia corallincola TaxID=2835133 RepID=A0ABS5TPU8_9ACTN|nr:ferritin [Kineosporia corallincola]MBT0772379.1 ferritin [Kineosporia corallincola]
MSVENPKFVTLLHEQIGHEFTAMQQYVALAVWFDAHDLPQLAGFFYRQSLEERTHAMMMVRYLLDRDVPPHVPGIGEVRNDFSAPTELVALALAQEQRVTTQIEALFKAARDRGDFLGEQFVLWFLKEQVEEVSSMQTLLTICERAGDDYFKIEDFVARETGDGPDDPSAPPVAGGSR